MRRRGVPLVVSLLVAGLLVAGPAPSAFAALPPSEWVIGPNQKVVFLTLDGQAKPGIVAKVLEALEDKHADASFFMSGAWVSRHDNLARQIRKAGHFFGNRGWGKESFTTLSDGAIRASIDRARSALNRIGAFPAPFLRAPNGARDLRVLRVAGAMGYRSVHETDPTHAGLAKKVQWRAVRQAQKGSIISLDIWRKSHRKALPGIVDGLRRRGFSLGLVKRLDNVHAVRWDVTVRSGSSGSEVAYLQKRLNQISYPAGGADGSFGYATLQATYAFEKANGLARDGVVTPSQMLQIAASEPPWVPKRGHKRFIEIDISRQVLFEIRNGRTIHTLPISSGNEEQYTVDGVTYTAHTPRGNFTIQRKIAGKRVSRLGTLWWPNYFTGGYAIHGSDSVPTYPASHGCVRIPRYLEVAFFNRNPVGIPTYVHD